MNEEQLFNKPVGNKEIERLGPKPVVVDTARIEEKGTNKTPLLILSVKHPDQEETLDLSKAQFIEGTNVKTVGLWISQDADENIQKGSAVAKLMAFYNITQLVELKDITLQTILDDKKYLCIKAY
jgi:hypothetical protein